MTADGWLRIQEGQNDLWRFQRGDWCFTKKRIVDVRIALDGTSLWIKVA